MESQTNYWIVFLSGVGGALIGTIGSALTIWLQTRAQLRQDRLKLVKELALEDIKLETDLAIKSNKAISISTINYIYYYFQLVKLMENDNLNEEKILALRQKAKKLHTLLGKED